MTLVESEASCRLHSTFGQTRNHSPVCKPPILQDVGNLEQETTITHTLTSLSLTPCSPGWEMERLQNMETVIPAQVCTKPHTPDDHRSGESMLHFKLFKRHSFFPGSSLSCTYNTNKLHLFCFPQITYFKANPSELQNAPIIGQMLGFFQEKKLDRYCDGQLSVSGWAGQSPVIQPNTHLDVAMQVFCGCGSYPTSELK